MRTRGLTVLLLLGGLLAGSALPAGLWAQQQPAPSPPTKPELPKPLEIPPAEKERKNPVSADSKSLEAGRKLFDSQCVMCHGADGKGKGELAVELGWTMPDFTSPKMKERTDGELFYILTRGHNHMPGQEGRLREAQRWNLINLIRSLASLDGKREEETQEK